MTPKISRRLIWLPTGGHIGDAVMVTSLFAEITTAKPDIQIFYLVRRNASFISELAKAYPAITVIPVPFSPLGALSAVLPIFRHRAVVIVPPAWGKHPLIIKILAFLCVLRGDTVVGFKDWGKWQPYTLRAVHDRSVRYIDTLRAAAHLVSLPTATLGSPPRVHLLTTLPPDFAFSNQLYIVLHPFPHMLTSKTLPLRRWKDLVRELQERYPAYGIVITGAEVDRAQAEELAAVGHDIFLAIDRPLREVAGLIEHARLYIGVDTGPTHIAGVLHAPSIVLAHQNEPLWLPTYNPNATLIWEKKNCTCGTSTSCDIEEEGKPYRHCVYDISDEMILNAIAAKLARASGV